MRAAAGTDEHTAIDEGARGLDHHLEALAHRQGRDRLGKELVHAGVAAVHDHLAGEAGGDQDDRQAAHAAVFLPAKLANKVEAIEAVALFP